jgi:hypothetical protein
MARVLSDEFWIKAAIHKLGFYHVFLGFFFCVFLCWICILGRLETRKARSTEIPVLPLRSRWELD